MVALVDTGAGCTLICGTPLSFLVPLVPLMIMGSSSYGLEGPLTLKSEYSSP